MRYELDKACPLCGKAKDIMRHRVFDCMGPDVVEVRTQIGKEVLADAHDSGDWWLEKFGGFFWKKIGLFHTIVAGSNA